MPSHCSPPSQNNRIQSRKEVIIRTYYKLIKVDSSLCEVSYPCLERCVQGLVGYCLAARTAAGPLMICATCLRPPYINLNSLFCSPPTMDRPADDCECNLKETMSLFNELQGAEMMRRSGVLKLADIY